MGCVVGEYLDGNRTLHKRSCFAPRQGARDEAERSLQVAYVVPVGKGHFHRGPVQDAPAQRANTMTRPRIEQLVKVHRLEIRILVQVHEQVETAPGDPADKGLYGGVTGAIELAV